MIRPRTVQRLLVPGTIEAAQSTERRLDRATAVASIVVPVSATLSILIWLVLQRLYDLDEKFGIAYFAFEKVPGHFDSPVLRRTLALFIAASLLYGIGIVAIARAKAITPAIKMGALAAMIGPGVVNIAIYPAGALDVFNYMVDLKLAYHYHANPYVVTNPSFLDDDPVAKSAFMLHVPLFYGPAWLLFSGIPALLSGFDDVVALLMSMKAFNLVLLAATAYLIARMQPTTRRRWLAPFVFLGNPLVVFEGVGNAHNDVMMTVFMVAAIVAIRRERLGWTSAPALALSALVKLFSGVLAPLFVLEAVLRRWRLRSVLLAGIATIAITIAVTAPFWDGGQLWTGFREGTRLSQQMDHVSLLSLAQQRLKQEIVDSSPRNAFRARNASADVVSQSDQNRLHREFTAAFVVLAGLVILARAKGLLTLERAAALTLMLFALLMTNLYPWYLIPIIALLAIELEALGLAYVLVATLLSLAYYPAYVWAHFNTDLSLYQVHLYLAIFLTAPMVAMVTIDGFRTAVDGYGRWLSGRRPAGEISRTSP